MAHDRQEVRLGGVRAFGGFLGDREFRGPGGNLALQAGDLGGDPLIARADAVQHFVEAADEVAQFALGDDLRRLRIVLGLADAVGEPRQTGDRLADPAGHAQGDQKAGQQGDTDARQADQDCGDYPRSQAGHIAEQGDLADRDAVIQDWRSDLDGAGLHGRPQGQVTGLDDIGVGVQANATAGFGQQVPACRLDARIGDVRHLPDRPHGQKRPRGVVPGDGRRRHGPDHAGGLGQVAGFGCGLAFCVRPS